MMGHTPLAVRVAQLTERARRAPGFARRRWRRLRGRFPGLGVDTRSGSTAAPGSPGPDPRDTGLHDRERATWRASCTPLVDDVRPDRARARELLLRSSAMDATWYLDVHADRIEAVADSDADPAALAADHYLDVGWRQGLAPSRWIDLEEVAARVGTSDLEPVSLLEALRERLDLRELQRRLDLDRPAGIPRDDVELRWRDLIEGQLPHEPTFVLYRILGNDLPPRHEVGQSERNLRFLLEHEPELAGCERRYVVNRVVDPEVERRLLEILDAHDAPVLHLPFDRDDYRGIGWRVSDFTRPGMLYGTNHDGLPVVNRARAIDHAFHDKNLYVMHNNGARNAALEDGRARARWVLPFDGNCFFTTAAWEELRSAVLAAPHRRYLVVPMARVNVNDQLLSSEPIGRATDEPQIAFRNDAPETFHPDARYGRRPKVELLRRLGVPGAWDEWPDEAWEPNLGHPCNEAGEYLTAGWVARLASGRPTLEADASGRMVSRMEAIRTVLTEVDEQVLRERFRAGLPVFHDLRILEQQREAGTVGGRHLVIEVAAEHARWENVEAARTPLGRGPLVLRRAVLRAVADTFAGFLLQDEPKVARGAQGIAQIVSEDEVQAGLIASPLHPREFASLLDASRLLAHHDALDAATAVRLRTRVEEHRATLLDDAATGQRRRALDETGVWFEVEHLASAAYLDDAAMLLEGLRRAAGRLHDQFVVLPEKGPRWRRRVAASPNLLGWAALLRPIDRWRIALCDSGSSALARHRTLARAVAERVPAIPSALLVAPRDASDVAGPAEPASGAPSTLLEGSAGTSGVPPFWWAGVLLP